MNARSASVADLARLNFVLGELYADAVRTAQRRARLECELVGCHGQTLYHQGNPARSSAAAIACTWQTGEAAIIAAKVGVPVVSDFRPADMAAGGKGAPLVPFLDYVLYRHRRYGRIVQNLGGIGNLTAIPPRALPEQLVAFDTGPGNMVIDAVTEHLFDKPFDRNGRLAARGEPIERVLRELLRHPFFRQKPPKTAGREQFGREFVREFLRLCRRADENDIVATATALTARSIGVAVQKIRVAAAGDTKRKAGALSRVCRLRRRNEECDADGDDPRRTCAAEDARAHHRRVRASLRSERSGGIRAAGVPDLAALAVECSFRHRRQAAGDPGQSQLCVELVSPRRTRSARRKLETNSPQRHGGTEKKEKKEKTRRKRTTGYTDSQDNGKVTVSEILDPNSPCVSMSLR